jgi:hypothetical protein
MSPWYSSFVLRVRVCKLSPRIFRPMAALVSDTTLSSQKGKSMSDKEFAYSHTLTGHRHELRIDEVHAIGASSGNSPSVVGPSPGTLLVSPSGGLNLYPPPFSVLWYLRCARISSSATSYRPYRALTVTRRRLRRVETDRIEHQLDCPKVQCGTTLPPGPCSTATRKSGKKYQNPRNRLVLGTFPAQRGSTSPSTFFSF